MLIGIKQNSPKERPPWFDRTQHTLHVKGLLSRWPLPDAVPYFVLRFLDLRMVIPAMEGYDTFHLMFNFMNVIVIVTNFTPQN